MKFVLKALEEDRQNDQSEEGFYTRAKSHVLQTHRFCDQMRKSRKSRATRVQVYFIDTPLNDQKGYRIIHIDPADLHQKKGIEQPNLCYSSRDIANFSKIIAFLDCCCC